MNIEQLKEDAQYLRELGPKELATELRTYVENMNTDHDIQSTWCMTNILRAADLLEEGVR